MLLLVALLTLPVFFLAVTAQKEYHLNQHLKNGGFTGKVYSIYGFSFLYLFFLYSISFYISSPQPGAFVAGIFISAIVNMFSAIFGDCVSCYFLKTRPRCPACGSTRWGMNASSQNYLGVDRSSGLRQIYSEWICIDCGHTKPTYEYRK